MSKSNPTLKTTRKVIESLKRKKQATNISTIADEVGLNWMQVEGVVEFLDELNLIEILKTNTGRSLFKLKGYQDESSTD